MRHKLVSGPKSPKHLDDKVLAYAKKNAPSAKQTNVYGLLASGCAVILAGILLPTLLSNPSANLSNSPVVESAEAEYGSVGRPSSVADVNHNQSKQIHNATPAVSPLPSNSQPRAKRKMKAHSPARIKAHSSNKRPIADTPPDAVMALLPKPFNQTDIKDKIQYLAKLYRINPSQAEKRYSAFIQQCHCGLPDKLQQAHRAYFGLDLKKSKI